ncbi:putative bifunctional diguanylate cyclase/phosphodiesterase [Janthinobacterium sp. RB2R34]|uniref:putative bifunctional diguanylate cyclase/phosphodiesterase n=1 Tax=Janthinobacterium sp. RB2R34 TaxID=3424193 RepID=UPI003F23DE8F
MASSNDLAHWRGQIFSRLLQVVVVLGIVTAIPSALLAAREGIWAIVAIDIGSIAWIIVLWQRSNVRYRWRVSQFLGVTYIVGIGLLLKIGPVSQIYMMVIPVLAALLLGLQPALYMLALTTTSLFLLGLHPDISLQLAGVPASLLLRSLIVALNFLFIAAVLTLSTAFLLRHLEQSLNRLHASTLLLEREIAERKKSEQDIHQLAFYDVLTALPNRRLLMDRIGQLLAAAQREHTVSALMFIDLDHFKHINDARGHATGDALLRIAGERLAQLMRKADTVARIGGDEFVVLLAHLAPEMEAAAQAAGLVAEKIRAAIARDFDIDDHSYHCSASIGVTLLPKRGQQAHDLLREADIAMYRAKAEGRNGIAFFEVTMQAGVEHRLTIERALAHALDASELRMHVQPQLDRHGQVTGAEMLMRWPQADGSMIAPSLFIPIAEETGLIVKLGNWALRQACKAVVQLAQAGHHFALSVNVSPAQFRQPDFAARVRAALSESGAPAGALVLELTEGLLVDKRDAALARMRELAALGIRFSIDDFGTGYSSLAYLTSMPLYELKIDKSFIDATPHDASSTAIVQAILGMAGHLGLRVVAEGVETQQQADFLIDHDCDGLQGYLYARPMPMDDLLKWLAQRP